MRDNQRCQPPRAQVGENYSEDAGRESEETPQADAPIGNERQEAMLERPPEFVDESFFKSAPFRAMNP